MITQFMDTAAGTAVYINPTYVVTLRPDPADPDHVSIITLRNGESVHAIEAYLQKAREAPLDLYETLTTRERGVLHLAAEGRTNTDIAAALFVSPRTVETHRAHLMRKLGLHTRADLIRYGLQRGIVPLDS